MRVGFDGPPALLQITGNSPGVQQRSAAVGPRVVRPSIVPHRPFIALSHPVKSRRILVVVLPNPPAVVWPFISHVAVPIAKNQHSRGFLNARPAADIVLITRGAPEWRGCAPSGPVH